MTLLYTGYARIAANADLDALTASVDRQWGPNSATTTGLTYGYAGGVALTAAGVQTTVAAATVALANNATNYIERTHLGAVSSNTTGFTAGRIAMAKVVTLAGAITSTEDYRFLTPYGYFPILTGEAGVTDPRYPVGNVLRYGATGDGVTNDGPAVQAAVTAVAALTGMAVYFPAGRYKLNTAVALSSNSTLRGEGNRSVLVGGAAVVFLLAQSKTNIVVADLCIEYQNCRFEINLSSNITIRNVRHAGLLATNEHTQQGVWTKGSTSVRISECEFEDFNNAVYLDRSGATNSSGVTVEDCAFKNTTVGTIDPYPVGVYAYYADDVEVNGCTFTNIQSGSLIVGAMGYGVYEGDGSCSEIRVLDCRFRSTSGTNPGYMNGVQINFALVGHVSGCSFRMAAPGFSGAAGRLTIHNNEFIGCSVHTKGNTGSPTVYKSQTITDNKFFDVTNSTPLIVQNDGDGLAYAKVSGNHFTNSIFGAIWIRIVTTADVTDNTIVDCNTGNTLTEPLGAAIAFFGCSDGFVDGNTVTNLVAGKAQWAVSSASGTHSILITANNKFRNMIVATVLRPINATPTVGRWERGTVLPLWEPVAGGVPAIVCVTSGTPGTWKAMAALAP